MTDLKDLKNFVKKLDKAKLKVNEQGLFDRKNEITGYKIFGEEVQVCWGVDWYYLPEQGWGNGF